MRKLVVGRADEFKDGDRVMVQLNETRSIGVFRENGSYYALLNRCPHQGAELCRGDVVGLLKASSPEDMHYDGSHKLLVCPWHGWEFDLTTGQSYFDPQRTRVRRYPVEVESGASLEGANGLVEGPYKAEMFPVSVEDDYVVVVIP